MLVTLLTQHAMRMHHIVVCGLPGSTILFHIVINGNIKKKNTEHKIYVFLFSVGLFSEIFFILRGTERDMTKNVCWSSCTVPVILVRY
jgi:hypothetical protein